MRRLGLNPITTVGQGPTATRARVCGRADGLLSIGRATGERKGRQLPMELSVVCCAQLESPGASTPT